MKRFLSNYLTAEQERVLLTIVGIFFMIWLFSVPPINSLYSEVVSEDSIMVDIQKPRQLKIDLRSSSVEEIAQIKGIGIKKASWIVDFREQHGISSNYDILAVKGIGKKTLAKILPSLVELPKDKKYTQNVAIKSTKIVEKIDINRASKTDFMLVKGIGSKRADDIISLRSKKGKFTNLSELLEIKGIGKKTLAKIEEFLYIVSK